MFKYPLIILQRMKLSSSENQGVIFLNWESLMILVFILYFFLPIGSKKISRPFLPRSTFGSRFKSGRTYPRSWPKVLALILKLRIKPFLFWICSKIVSWFSKRYKVRGFSGSFKKIYQALQNKKFSHQFSSVGHEI